MPMTLSGLPKNIEHLDLSFQWKGCIHFLYTPFMLLYAFDFEWLTEKYIISGSFVATGMV